MAIKHILAPVLRLEEDRATLQIAGTLAAGFGSRATALIVTVSLGSDFAHAQSTLSELLSDIAAGEQSAAAKERAKFDAWLENSPHDFDVHAVTVETAVREDDAVSHARYADLVVLARAEHHSRARRALLEDMVFKSGRPILLLPERSPEHRAWDRVLIAWKPSAEAARAVSGALPFLKLAKHVRLVTVDAAPERKDAATPGRDLAGFLALHGVNAELSNIDGLGREESRAIADAARDFGADLLVMGAYGRSRASEFVLGGVSQDMLAASATPLLLAH